MPHPAPPRLPAARVLVALLALVGLTVGLAACSSGGGGDDASTTTVVGAGDKGTTKDTSGANEDGVGGHCGQYLPGQGGVVQTFCAGTATIRLAIGDRTHTFRHGVCTQDATRLSVNAGAVAGQDFQGPLPDYFGTNLPADPGPFSGPAIAMAFQLDGQRGAITKVTGNHDGTSGRFTGTVITGPSDGNAVQGSFICSS